MGLSRLENFLRSVKGSTIHVNSDSVDSTDSIENDGSSIVRPFKSIQRALIEVVRFSYRSGNNNDLFGRTTIIVHPSQYDIDNRPGLIVKDDGSYFQRNGLPSSIEEWRLPTNFNVYDQNNELYKLNSIYGGVIIPRGVTLWAYDLRKTIIRPLYVPNPYNTNIKKSSIFKLTGAALPEGFTYLDSNPNGFCYFDYTTNKLSPTFSHHKLNVYDYVDGVNNVEINDDFINVTTSRTDLQMYYEKIAKVYGEASGRPIEDAIYSTNVFIDLQPIIDEIRIVGSRGKEVGITSIRSGDGITPNTTITVTLNEEIDDISVDSPIEISGVGLPGYDGQYVVYSVISPSQLQYKSAVIPTDPLPSTIGATFNMAVDSVTSASPYIKKNTLRSVYGMCGFEADGSLVEGFKSSVISEFTGVSVQKDDNAFVKYDSISGSYKDSTTISNLHKDPLARYKPEFEHYHIKLSNDAFSETVSSFAIGFAKQYYVESGGDLTLNATKSDFGAKAFVADGFKKEAFSKDDTGYIVGVIPPKQITSDDYNIEFYSLNVGLTTAVGISSRIYIQDATTETYPPIFINEGYRIGAKQNEIISVELSNNGVIGISTAKVCIPGSTNSFEKSYTVQRINNNTENSVANNVLTLTSNHNFINGEKVRVISSNGQLPDGLTPHRPVYVITTGLASNKIKVAETYNNALNNNAITLNRKGGTLRVTSIVSDRICGELGHPIQWDNINSNWYINVDVSNEIYSQFNTLGVNILGPSTPNIFVTRKSDKRTNPEKIYRFKHVIPFNSALASRPPLEGYIIQESNSSKLGSADISKYYPGNSVTLITSDELRNPHYISDVKWSSNYATIYTEIPHKLTVGSEIETVNVIDGTYSVVEIVSPTQFKIPLSNNPGIFNKNTSLRNDLLPYFKRIKTNNTYQIYSVEEVQEYIHNKQDGIYNLVVVNNSNSPTVSPFKEFKFSQPIENLYPQLDRDNINSDPEETVCFALPDKIGEVVVDDERKSITKETYYKFSEDFSVGLAITGWVSNSTGLAHTLFVNGSHNFNKIGSVTVNSVGSNYLQGTYFGAQVLSTGSGKNATAKIVINSGGTLDSIIIMDGGGGFGIGNTAVVVPAAGFGTTTGFTPAVVSVSQLNNSEGDTVYLQGNSSAFRITGINTSNEIRVSSATTTIITKPGLLVSAGKSILINTFDYTPSTGIATIGVTTSHGILVNEKIQLGGFNHPYFSQETIVEQVPTLTSLIVNLGKDGEGLDTSGTRYVYPTINSNLDKIVYYYDGLTTFITTQLTFNSLSDVLVIPNASSIGLNIGDFLKVNDEIFRIKSTVNTNNVSVFRSQLGTIKQSHPVGSIVRKIMAIPVELRKNSSIRASSHTLEYVGFGPGNYSTALPERQSVRLSNKERNLAHAFKTNGGRISYVANDENGDFYNTNKKTYSITGKEETYDSPLIKVTGETPSYSNINTSEIVIDNSLKVSGGDNLEYPSEFNGPIIINNKLTSYSQKGIEAFSFLIRGNENTSRNIGIGSTTPTTGGYGDIIFNTLPTTGEYIGWTYTTNNLWEGFGKIGE
jgi:hypothetical protein